MALDFLRANQNVIRSPKNPLDLATIISAFPKSIYEKNHTIYPGVFQIPAAADGDVEVLTLGSSSWFRQVNPDEPAIEVTIPATEVARSVVDDYIVGLLGIADNAKPALFYAPGRFNKLEAKTKFAAEIKAALELQRNWFMNLIKIADSLWVRTNGQPSSISEDARLGARILNLDKEWMKDSTAASLIKCVACGYMVQDQYPVCPNCKVVLNKKKFDELKLQFAQ